MHTASYRSSLIQRHGDAELPADGRWTLHRASFVGISTRRNRRQLTVADGSLTIIAPPGESTLVITAALGEQWIRLTASTVAVDADRFGFSRWQLNGTIDDGTTRHPIELGMTYHGVHGQHDAARAWFTGRATNPTVHRRFLPRRTQLDVVLDLLFDPPTTPNAAALRRRAADHQPTDLVSVDPRRLLTPGDDAVQRQRQLAHIGSDVSRADHRTAGRLAVTNTSMVDQRARR